MLLCSTWKVPSCFPLFSSIHDSMCQDAPSVVEPLPCLKYPLLVQSCSLCFLPGLFFFLFSQSAIDVFPGSLPGSHYLMQVPSSATNFSLLFIWNPTAALPKPPYSPFCHRHLSYKIKVISVCTGCNSSQPHPRTSVPGPERIIKKSMLRAGEVAQWKSAALQE